MDTFIDNIYWLQISDTITTYISGTLLSFYTTKADVLYTQESFRNEDVYTSGYQTHTQRRVDPELLLAS